MSAARGARLYPGRCTTHHGCKCREWANAELPRTEARLAEAERLLANLMDAIAKRDIARWQDHPAYYAAFAFLAAAAAPEEGTDAP